MRVAPAGWAALLILGQVAALTLVRAGPLVGYQHYPPLASLGTQDPPWALLVLALQSLAVGWALFHRGGARVRMLVSRIGWPRVMGVAAVLVVSSAALSRRPMEYLAEVLLASAIQWTALGTTVLCVVSLSKKGIGTFGLWYDRIVGPATGTEPEPGGPDGFAWTLAIGVTLVAALLAILSYERHPHVPDEVSYLLQAGYFSKGLLSLPIPPVPEAFNVDLMTYEATRWFSPFPPGWAAMLALGTLGGAPWIVNPLLGGINVLLAYSFLRELYPRRTTRLAIFLIAVSPWPLFLAMSYMAHTLTLTLALLAALAITRLLRRGWPGWAILAGLVTGLISLVRPLDALACAILISIWLLVSKRIRPRVRLLAWFGAGAMASGALNLAYNQHLTGSWRSFPVMAYMNSTYTVGRNAMGFGPDRGLGWTGLDPLPGHGAVDVFVNAALNLFQVQVDLHGWATGSLLLLALLLVRQRLHRVDWGMLGAITIVVGLHSFYWFSGGPDFGARYWFLILIPCVALGASTLSDICDSLEMAEVGLGSRFQVGIALLSLSALAVFMPWRAIDKYSDYRGMRPEIRALERDWQFQNGVVLIRGCRHPDYASAIVYNSLELSQPDPVYVWDRGPKIRGDLARAFPDRTFWIVNGPSLTLDGYRLAGGPLSASELLAADQASPTAPSAVVSPCLD